MFIERRYVTTARYIEPIAMSIRIASPPPSSLALMREARPFFARSFGFAVVAMPGPVLSGTVGALPALSGLMLFTVLLIGAERSLAMHHPHPRLGAANRITLVRAGISCLIAARAIDPAPLGAPERWLLAAIAGTALLLDGADGWAARHQRLVSSFGARFDMEVDALTVLALAVTVARAAAVPPWVLAIGSMRYLYFAAGWLFPLLRQPLPCHQVGDWRRKTIAVVQSVTLVVALAPATSSAWAVTLCTTALGLLIYSFAADIVMLARGGIGEVE